MVHAHEKAESPHVQGIGHAPTVWRAVQPRRPGRALFSGDSRRRASGICANPGSALTRCFNQCADSTGHGRLLLTMTLAPIRSLADSAAYRLRSPVLTLALSLLMGMGNAQADVLRHCEASVDRTAAQQDRLLRMSALSSGHPGSSWLDVHPFEASRRSGSLRARSPHAQRTPAECTCPAPNRAAPWPSDLAVPSASCARRSVHRSATHRAVGSWD